MDGSWRALAVRCAAVHPGDAALDVCCGTGDLAIALHDAVSPGGRVVGLDFSQAMLDAAARKRPQVEWMRGDALALPFADGEFAAATIGFGMRNLADHLRGFRELRRVVAPGGPGRVPRADRPAGVGGALRAPVDRPRRAAARPRWSRARPTPTATCRRRCTASRRPTSWRRSCTAPACAASATGGSRAARWRCMLVRSRHDSGRRRRGAGGPGPAGLRRCGRGGARAGRRLGAGCGRLGRRVPRRCGRAASGCGRCSCTWRRRYAGASCPGSSRRAARSSSCTWRRSSTTTSSTPRGCGADGRRCGRRTARRSRARPATTCSRGRSPSSCATGDMDAVTMLSEACLALARGEILQREQTGEPADDAGAVPGALPAQDRAPVRRRGHARRTAAAACTTARSARLGEFATALGLAFQIADDILDCDGRPDTTGKPLGTDLLDGTVTLPLILGAARDPAVAGVIARGATREDVLPTLARVARSGAVRDARAVAERHADAALAHLESLDGGLDTAALPRSCAAPSTATPRRAPRATRPSSRPRAACAAAPPRGGRARGGAAARGARGAGRCACARRRRTASPSPRRLRAHDSRLPFQSSSPRRMRPSVRRRRRFRQTHSGRSSQTTVSACSIT